MGMVTAAYRMPALSSHRFTVREDGTHLLDLWPALWTFVTHPEVPPTNNLVERAIRSLVLRRKISYVTRSKRGIHFVQRMFSVAQTCRLQCRSGYDFMIHTLVAWFHQRAGPSLAPSTSGSC